MVSHSSIPPLTLADFGVWSAPPSILLLISFVVQLRRLTFRNEASLDYILANQQAPLLCVASSFCLSLTAPLAILLLPPATLIYGFSWLWLLAGLLFAAVYSYVVVIPIVYYVRPLSLYSYLEHRFATRSSYTIAIIIRITVATAYIILSLTYVTIVMLITVHTAEMFFPGPKYLLPICLGFISTFLAAAGGSAAIYMASPILLLFVISGPVAVLVIYCVTVAEYDKSGILTRQIFEDMFDFSKVLRNLEVNPFSVLLAGFMWFTFALSSDQVFAQCTGSVTTFRRARCTTLLTIALSLILLILTGSVSFVVLLGMSESPSCDAETVFQFMVQRYMLTAARIPAVRGLILSSICCALFGSLVSRLHAISVVMVEDWIRSCLVSHGSKTADGQLSEVWYIVTCVVCGLLVSVTVTLLQLFQNSIYDFLFYILFLISSITGPIVGLIMLAILFPCANNKGALIGLVAGALTAGTLTSWQIYGGKQDNWQDHMGFLQQCDRNASDKVYSTAVPSVRLSPVTNDPKREKVVPSSISRSLPTTEPFTYAEPITGFTEFITTRYKKAVTTAVITTIVTPVTKSHEKPGTASDYSESPGFTTESTLAASHYDRSYATGTTSINGKLVPISAHSDSEKSVVLGATTTRSKEKTSWTTGQPSLVTATPFLGSTSATNDTAGQRDLSRDDVPAGFINTTTSETATLHTTHYVNFSENDTNLSIRSFDTESSNYSEGLLSYFLALNDKAAISFSGTSGNESEEGIPSGIHAKRALSPLYYPCISGLVTIAFGLIFSMATGGTNLYTLDWNLVHWTCSPLTECSHRRYGFRNRKLKSKPEYMLCRMSITDSLRDGNNLPDTHYSNMRLFQSLQRESAL